MDHSKTNQLILSPIVFIMKLGALNCSMKKWNHKLLGIYTNLHLHQERNTYDHENSQVSQQFKTVDHTVDSLPSKGTHIVSRGIISCD